jgi:hypothetical protein
MMLLVVVFFLLMLMTLTVVMFATAPAKDVKIIDQRMSTIGVHAPGSGELPVEAAQLLRKTPTSRFGWVDDTLRDFKPSQSIGRWVSQSGVKTTPAVVLMQSIGVCHRLHVFDVASDRYRRGSGDVHHSVGQNLVDAQPQDARVRHGSGACNRHDGSRSARRTFHCRID